MEPDSRTRNMYAEKFLLHISGEKAVSRRVAIK